MSEKQFETNTGQGRALLLCLDGLRFACAICEVSIARAIAKLHTFESAHQRGVPIGDAVAVVADIWSVIDSAHRVRELVKRTPIVSRRAPYVRTFMDRTASAEELRHYVQHLAKEIGRHAEGGTPLWGAISWVSADDPMKSFTLMTGNHYLGWSLPSPVFDRHERKFVGQVHLAAGATSIDVADVALRVSDLNRQVHEWSKTLRFSTGETYEYAPTVVPLISARVVLGEQTQHEPATKNSDC